MTAEIIHISTPLVEEQRKAAALYKSLKNVQRSCEEFIQDETILTEEKEEHKAILKNAVAGIRRLRNEPEEKHAENVKNFETPEMAVQRTHRECINCLGTIEANSLDRLKNKELTPRQKLENEMLLALVTDDDEAIAEIVKKIEKLDKTGMHVVS